MESGVVVDLGNTRAKREISRDERYFMRGFRQHTPVHAVQAQNSPAPINIGFLGGGRRQERQEGKDQTPTSEPLMATPPRGGSPEGGPAEQLSKRHRTRTAKLPKSLCTKLYTGHHRDLGYTLTVPHCTGLRGSGLTGSESMSSVMHFYSEEKIRRAT